jgi:sugar lactone lactonase YvrE
MAYGQGNGSGWKVGIPVLAIALFGVRLLALCGRSSSSYSPNYNFNIPSPPPKIDYGALLGLDGSTSTSSSKTNAPEAIAVDATNVYFTDQKGLALYAQGKAGGERKLLTPTTGAVRAIAVGTTDVYFATSTTFAGRPAGTIMKVPTRGGLATPIIPSGTYIPERIATDGRFVFFTSPNEDSLKTKSVLRLAVTGLVASPLDVDPNAPPSDAVAIDATNAYYTSQDGTQVASVPKAGGETTVLAGDQLLAREIALDADAVYWTDSLAGKVMKVAKKGGTAIEISSGESDVAGIAVDASYVYWITQTSGTKLSTLMRSGKSGGIARPIAAGLSGVRNVASDGTRTYWTANGTVFYIGANDPAPISGGAKVNVLGAPAALGTFDAGVASRGNAYGTGGGSLGSGGGSLGAGGVIRTFRSKDR